MPPRALDDLGAWKAYKRAAHLYALPEASRLFLRRGQMAMRAGSYDEGVRLVRGAAELDPRFLEPQLTLASWLMTRDPSQAMLRCVAAFHVVRASFLPQLEFVQNTVFFSLHGLFLGLLAAALLIVMLRQSELRHIWEERLGRLLGRTSTRIWAWVLLVLPFLLGLGVALPAAVLMGFLWPVLRPRERFVHVALLLALLAAPFAGHVMGRLANPMRDDRGPLFGLAGLNDESWSADRHATIAALAERHADDPFVMFAFGWSARAGGDQKAAESAYRRALQGWPDDSRVLNNLANVLASRGDFDPAVELYRRSVAVDPENASAYFNLSQVLIRQFDFPAASEATARASAIDFDLVKTYQAMGTDDGVLPLADQWVAPSVLWQRVAADAARPGADPALPFAWRGRIETSGIPFAVAVLVLGLGSLALGTHWQKEMPLRNCSNCGRVICRRCARRRRETALCPTCARQEASAESPEFAKMLLARIRGQVARRERRVRTALAVVLPGYGLLAFQQVFTALCVLVTIAQVCAPWLGAEAPFAYQARIGHEDPTLLARAALGVSLFLHLVALIGYFTRQARASAEAASQAAPVRRSAPRPPRPTVKAA